MAELDDVVALALSPERGWSSVRQEGHAFQDRLAARRAFEQRRREISRRRSSSTRAVTSVPIGVRDQEWKLWRQSDGRLRSEFLIGRETVTVVAHGDRWSRSSPTLGTVHGGGTSRPLRTLIGPAAVLLDPAALLHSTELQNAHSITVLNRRAVVITARPAALRGRALMALREAGLGADEYEITIDADTGVLLAVVARRDDVAFQIVETTAIAFDEIADESLFAFGQATSGREHTLAPRRTTLSEAAAQVNFELYAPYPPPSPTEPHVALVDGDRHLPGPRRVVLTYPIVDEHRRGQLRLTMAGVDLPRSTEVWERRGEFEVTLGRRRAIDRSKVRRRIGGTTCELESSVLELDQLVEIASTLSLIPS